MNPIIKRYLVSSLTTFLTTFLSVAALQLQAAGAIELNSAFFVGIAGVAIRAAFKAVVEAVPTLGSADKK